MSLASLLVVACGDDDAPGSPDSGPARDAATLDAPARDAADRDTGEPDAAAPIDAGEDAGEVPDLGPPDLGPPDLGPPDLGPVDAGAADSGTGFPAECSTCHGDAVSPAPPRDVAGSTDTASRGVGAHRGHLRTSDWHRQVVCSDCHVVPTMLTSPGHFDAMLPADLTFSMIATSDGATPSFDGTSCSGTYCHGATLAPGGTNTMPRWTTVDGTQAACGTCHGLPPGGTHAAVPAMSCNLCHGEVVDASRTIIAPELHIDGIVQHVP